MLKRRINLWEEGEYSYPMSFGFCPNIVGYLHEENSGLRPCMVVVPGGGYRIVSPSEGEIVAERFFQKGFQTFVCTYTINLTGAAALKDQPMKDLSRAVRYIRKNAEELGVRSDQIVVCGFSAGGHLCGSLCVHYEDVSDDNPKFADICNRPDAACLCYPVITSGEKAHRDSFIALLGEEASEKELDYVSLEKHVTANTPPCFLWQTAADELVPVENSYLFAECLKTHGIPYAHHVFSSGPHALSLADETWARGEYGDPYTMEQVMKLVELVKNGAFPCTEEEKRALLDAFDYSGGQGETICNMNAVNREVEIWPELADLWLKEQFSR